MTIAQLNVDQLGAWVSGQGAEAFRYIHDEVVALAALADEVATQITALGVPGAGDAAGQHSAIVAAIAALQARLDAANAVVVPGLDH